MTPRQFDQLLKNSDYFHSCLQSHREAVAQTISVLCEELVHAHPETVPTMIRALERIGDAHKAAPSVAGDLSLIAREIRQDMQRGSGVRSSQTLFKSGQ